MPGMFPKTKKSKLDICTETAKFSAKLKHADVTHKTSVLKDSFEVRRICLTSNRNRKTGEEMKEIFPDMYSEAAVWTDLGMIMGLEEDVKEHVLHKIRHTAKKYSYAQTMINVESADKDDDELLALLAYGCGTTIGTLADPRNGVRQAVSVAAILVMAVLLAVLCVCLLGPRLLRLAADLCPCDLPLPLAPSGAHIPSGCRRSQADRGALEGCLMCDRGAAALTEQRRTLALSAQRDSELGLPPALPLPDGEEFPHSVNHIHIRTAEQEKEIYQAYIRPPPNRTIVGRQPSPSAVTSPSTPTAAVCARRPAASGAKSRPLTLESCQRCVPAVNTPELTVIVPVARTAVRAGSAPRPPERLPAVPPPGAERSPAATVATSITTSVTPPVTRSSRRLATDLPPGGGVRPARRASGRLAARAAAAAAGLFSRQR